MKKLAKFTFFAAICAGAALLFAFFAKYLADQNTELKALLSNKGLAEDDCDTFDILNDVCGQGDAE